jgi:hypothetical protein
MSESLAERQAALVAALVTDAPVPPGFDADRLAATRRALLRKRASLAAREWPLLAASWGAAWPRVFAEHRAGHEPVGALRDGWDVARALRERGTLAAGPAAELAAREARMHYDGRSAPRRRSIAERAGVRLRRRLRTGRG